MNAPDWSVDLDDTGGLLAADRERLLLAAALAGAQVRATAAALEEGELDPLRADGPPRTVVWVAGRGNAETAGALLAAVLSGAASAPIVVVPEAPGWIGALDVVVIAGDDPGDPTLVASAATAVRRGARVAVVAPYEGPLRDATAGRCAAVAPRVRVPDDFNLARYFAAGLATLHMVDPRLQANLDELADILDAEAYTNSAAHELFTNPAKLLADRMLDRQIVFAGDNAATLALARHGAAVMLRVAHRPVAGVCLADVLVALRGGMNARGGSLFHDEQIDGPLPPRIHTVVLATDAERPVVNARIGGYDDIDVIHAGEVLDAPAVEPGHSAATGGRMEQQLARLAVRLEMAAAYLKLVRG
nr:MAG: TobH protein [Mycolicibacterium hassiacum]